jgi:hypothetical protein
VGDTSRDRGEDVHDRMVRDENSGGGSSEPPPQLRVGSTCDN